MVKKLSKISRVDEKLTWKRRSKGGWLIRKGEKVMVISEVELSNFYGFLRGWYLDA